MSETIKSFTNSAGRVFPVHGISPLLPDLIRAAVTKEWTGAGRALPAVPTYAVKTASGEMEVYEHTEKSLSTDEERAVWAAYQAAEQEFESAVNERIMRACFLAVDANPRADEEWRAEQAALGIALPETSIDLRLMYVQTEVIKGLDDLLRLQSAVLMVSGIMDEEQATAAEAAFQREMERARASES